MKRASSYDEFDEDHFYPRKRYVPLPSSATKRVILDYQDLIESSTSDFRSKHLILDFERRQRLLWLCDDLLGPYCEKYFHTTDYSELDQAVGDACRGLAWNRLVSIIIDGYFTAGGFPAGTKFLTNTLIMSATYAHGMLVHIEKSNKPRYNLFIGIEQKKSCDSMSYHFSCDARGNIDHFRP